MLLKMFNFFRKPFCLGDEDLRARMMARYLNEDNNIEIVKYDDTIKGEVSMINSILKNVLENY
jgi:hypothetical protein